MVFVVPILRLFMLLLNVYETYKTLKSPPPSARNGGRPSVRARTQRKRDMKGCLAVWIVWCCFATYDRTIDSMVRLFVPFYDEVKSLVIIFFILTRARGAEPIYLHIIRPIVKPHTGLLDSLLDMICMFGDILFLLSTLPVRLVLSWWRDTFRRKKQTHSTPLQSPTHRKREANTESSPGNSTASQSPPSHALRYQPNARKGSIRSNPARRQSVELQQSSGSSPTAPIRPRLPTEFLMDKSAVSSHNSLGRRTASGRKYASKFSPSQSEPSTEETRQSVSPNYQIWYPPSFEEHSEVEQSSTTYAPVSSNSDIPLDQPLNSDITEGHVDEWRLYPPFPAAYPPTPSPAPSTLVFDQTSNRSTITPSPRQPYTSVTHFPTIPEGSLAGTHNGFGLPPREPLHPSLGHSSSDGDSMFSGQGGRADIEGRNVIIGGHDDADGEGSCEGEDDDDFDVTLTTPFPPAFKSRTRSGMSNASTADSSVKSRPTALTTTDNASSTRTRTNSESSGSISISDSMSISDSSSMVARKRSFPQSNGHSHNLASTAVQRVTVSQVAMSQGVFQRKANNIVADAGDGYSSDSDSDDSSSIVSEEVEQRKRTILAPSREVLMENTRRGTQTKDLKRSKPPSANVPRSRPPNVTQVPQRSSSRLANLSAAPAISRRVTAPGAGSSHTNVHVASTVSRRASDRNPSRKKKRSESSS